MEDKKNQNQLNIELKEDVAQGVYSNLAVITHSPSEFVLDFVRVMPGVPKAQVKSRVIITPEHAKRLMNALMDNIKRYESIHEYAYPSHDIKKRHDYGKRPMTLSCDRSPFPC